MASDMNGTPEDCNVKFSCCADFVATVSVVMESESEGDVRGLEIVDLLAGLFASIRVMDTCF